MGQEERNPKCSISSYGGVRTRSSKKQKQKKVPQRGLGVAQLEKIRIEEQQKNYASVPAVSTLTPPQDSDPDMSVPAKGTAPLAKAFKYGGLENPGLPRYDPPPSSMVNASTTSSSFILNSQTEPPSNQIYHGNYAPIQQEEEKISGLKRSCPFSSEKLPVFPVHSKLLTSASTLPGSDVSASSAYGAELIYEPGTGSFRYSSFQASVSDAKSIPSKKQNGVFRNEFLTLGLPTLASAWPSTKSKQPFGSGAFADSEPPDNEIPHCQGRQQDSKFQKGPRWANQQGNYNYYSFLPSTKMHSDEGAASITNFRNGVADGTVDLDLKL
ncbi:protein SPEAR2-like isoform X1 [Syzygium oleosum]|uniref:protein SPEAR2-like isoform X1 n=1 Tax=Syzygium oleosum TaxID=219896 RepID=UPI0011D29AA5|nr:protein SPEAR2-like isoform X1 [Syzygium oleosum]